MLDRIGGVDFATYDDRPIAQIINDTRPENKNKYVKAKFALPERFRLAIDVGPSLVVPGGSRSRATAACQAAILAAG